MKMILSFLFVLPFVSLNLNAAEYKYNDQNTIFAARISKLNTKAKLLRLKINFENAKFLAKNDRIEFWNPSVPEKKCLGYLEGKSSRYLLIKLPKYKKCKLNVYFTTGSYLHLHSPNLAKNLVTAKELVEILHKKKLAIGARKKRYEKSLSGFIEKIDVTNKRYELLRQKLEIEWQRELSILAEDKTKSYALLKDSEAQLHDIDFKLQQYRVRDQNLIEDRWSLDPKLYIKK